MVKVTNSGIRLFLISAIQDIEKAVGLEKVDNEEQLINMALVFLFNDFDIGLALDHEEIIKDRNKILSDLNEVAKFLEEADLNKLNEFLERTRNRS